VRCISGLTQIEFWTRVAKTFGTDIMKNIPRRTFLQFTRTAVVAPMFSWGATAQTYPSRPITMIVAFAAGGTTDVMARILAERMKGSLGQPIIIDNIGGADGGLGAGRAARANPDGYTIELGFLGNHVLNGAFYSLPYDVRNDFVPISPLTRASPILFARKSFPPGDLTELVTWLKANPNKASVGVVTTGFRLLSMYFQKETGTQLTIVPYRGVAPARQDLVAGQIDLLFDAPDAMSLVQAGSIKAYAVANDTQFAAAADVPTFIEMGLSTLVLPGWYGLFAPLGTPKDIIYRLNAAAIAALTDPGVRSRLMDLTLEVFPREQLTPEALAALVNAGVQKWWPLIKELGIKP
jgi:tripartite-type tricarboxylate transporter receptor subunit TctC